MQVDAKQVRMTYTIREVIVVLVFLGGLVGHVIRTELAFDNVKHELAEVRKELAECKAQLVQRPGPVSGVWRAE